MIVITYAQMYAWKFFADVCMIKCDHGCLMWSVVAVYTQM